MVGCTGRTTLSAMVGINRSWEEQRKVLDIHIATVADIIRLLGREPAGKAVELEITNGVMPSSVEINLKYMEVRWMSTLPLTREDLLK